jgi:CheY-like chemotaxis protein
MFVSVAQFPYHRDSPIELNARIFMTTTLELPGTQAPPCWDRTADKPVKPLYGVLVVDDDEMVRSVLGLFFRRQSIPVWLASDGEEAVEIYAREGAHIGLVLLDLRMPEMDGPQTFHHLRELNPDVVCYFMSAEWYPYTEQELYEMGAAELLLKPLLFKVLADLVQGCLSDA